MMAYEDYCSYPGDPYDQDFSGSDEDVELRYDSIGRETKDARIVRFELGKDLEWVECWLPKSETSLGKNNTIWVPRWLVERHELEKYEV